MCPFGRLFFRVQEVFFVRLARLPSKIHKRLAHGACSSLVFTFCPLTSSWIAAPSQTRSLFESSCCVPSHQWISLLCEDFPFILHTHIGWATAPPLLFILPITFPIHLAVSFAHLVRCSFCVHHHQLDHHLHFSNFLAVFRSRT